MMDDDATELRLEIRNLRQQLRDARGENGRLRRAARQNERTIEALRRIVRSNHITEAERVFKNGGNQDDERAAGAGMGVRKGICPA